MENKLTLLKEDYAICRTQNGSYVPSLGNVSSFFSITKEKNNQITVVCDQNRLPAGFDGQTSMNWRCFRFTDQLDFNSIGIISRISRVLASNHIPIYTISTYNTDYILIPSRNLKKGFSILKESGYKIICEDLEEQ